MKVEMRDFVNTDSAAVNRIALAAFQQYIGQYEEWEKFSQRISNMAALAESAEIIVATVEDRIVGAVAYVAPGKAKASFFEPDWSVMRMLVVDPLFRGCGIGHTLAQECIRRAERDGAKIVALHTSPIMEVAIAMYLRMGFELVRDVPPIYGVPYAIYSKRVDYGASSNSAAATIV